MIEPRSSADELAHESREWDIQVGRCGSDSSRPYGSVGSTLSQPIPTLQNLGLFSGSEGPLLPPSREILAPHRPTRCPHSRLTHSPRNFRKRLLDRALRTAASPGWGDSTEDLTATEARASWGLVSVDLLPARRLDTANLADRAA